MFIQGRSEQRLRELLRDIAFGEDRAGIYF